MKVAEFFLSLLVIVCSLCPYEGGECPVRKCGREYDDPNKKRRPILYRWPIPHKCVEKPQGVDSTKTECLKFFSIHQYTRKRNNPKKRIAFCKKYHARLSMPKTCEQIQFLVSNKLDRGKCDKYYQLYLGAASDDNARSFRWYDDMHIGTTEWDDIWSGGEPNNVAGKENCLSQYRFYINDIHCSAQINMVCEICIPTKEVNGTLNHTLDICSYPSKEQKVVAATKGRCKKSMLFSRPDPKDEMYPLHKVCDLIPCPSYRWGPECRRQCFCKNFEACHQTTGQCPSAECERGFHGTRCDKNGCPRFRWGHNCENVCMCRDGEKCHPTIGLCPLGCMPGAVGATCRGVLDACPEGKYGKACNKKCNCAGICTREEGLCVSGCRQGWYGSKCDTTKCPLGRWGENCQLVCACKTEQANCDQKTGECGFGCAQGWTGKACDTSPDGQCEKNRAKCPGTDVFEPCKDGMWGRQCLFECVPQNCETCSPVAKLQGTVCDECEPYYLNENGRCDKRCRELKRYNATCGAQCSKYCKGDGSCNERNGTCLRGCKPGKTYNDSRCIPNEPEKSQPEEQIPWWLLLALLGALLTTYCCLCCFFIWKRRNKTEEEEEEQEDESTDGSDSSSGSDEMRRRSTVGRKSTFRGKAMRRKSTRRKSKRVTLPDIHGFESTTKDSNKKRITLPDIQGWETPGQATSRKESSVDPTPRKSSFERTRRSSSVGSAVSAGSDESDDDDDDDDDDDNDDD